MGRVPKTDGLSLDGKMEKSPVTVGDLALMDRNISKAYAFSESCPDEVKEYLEPVITMASDQFCEICDQMGIDPLVMDFRGYHAFVQYRDDKGDRHGY